MHVVPAEALPYVQSGALDADLFNVTLLVQSKLDDASSAELPLLLQGRGGPEVRRAPATPDAADKVQVLDEVGMVAVDGAKDEIRTVWEDLRGEQAELSATDARLAGAGKVWLDGTVRATLEDSVPQIGAPAGLGRPGTTAPASRSPCSTPGIDPAHPDLAGRVDGSPGLHRRAPSAVDDTATAPTSRRPSPAPAPAPAGTRKGVAPGRRAADRQGARRRRQRPTIADHRRHGVGRAQRRRRGQHEPRRPDPPTAPTRSARRSTG